MKNFRIISLCMIALVLVFYSCNKKADNQLPDPDLGNSVGNGDTSEDTDNKDTIKTDESLQNLVIDTVLVNEGESSMAIVWGKAEEGEIGIQIKYKDDIVGTDKTIEVGIEKDTTFLDGVKLGELVKYRTSYTPKSEGVKKLYAPFKNVVYVMMMDKSKFEGDLLPNDPPLQDDPLVAYGNMWDGVWSTDFANPYGNYRSINTNAPHDGKPTWVTIDMGVKVKLDSFNVHLYRKFTQYAMRKYEFWGTAELDGTGNWNNWIKLADVESIKPSGLPDGEYDKPGNDGEDGQRWLRGDNGGFDSSLPKVRYIRIKCIQNYFMFYGKDANPTVELGNNNLELRELTLWQVIGLDE